MDESGSSISFKCEFKLAVIKWILENGKNISGASRKFNVRSWLKQEESLVNQKSESRSSGSGCTWRFPLMEQAL